MQWRPLRRPRRVQGPYRPAGSCSPSLNAATGTHTKALRTGIRYGSPTGDSGVGRQSVTAEIDDQSD